MQKNLDDVIRAVPMNISDNLEEISTPKAPAEVSAAAEALPASPVPAPIPAPAAESAVSQAPSQPAERERQFFKIHFFSCTNYFTINMFKKIEIPKT